MPDASIVRDEFRKMQTRDDLARLLAIPPKTLQFLLYSSKGNRYTLFQVKKRRGGFREIRAPVGALKAVQRRLLDVLTQVYEPRTPVHGFCVGRSPATNAARHVGRRWVLNVDLQDFFPSISFARVRGLLMKWPYGLPSEVATSIAQLCTADGQLPQGAPTSPIISNMICGKLDSELRGIAKGHRCTYTRYADDISISCSLPSFPTALARLRPDGSTEVGPLLQTVIGAAGFAVNQAKIRLQHSSHRQEVTGLVVNEAVNVPREYARQVRSMVHALEKYGAQAAENEFRHRYDTKHRRPGKNPPDFLNVLHGKLRYMLHVKGRDDKTDCHTYRAG